MMDVLLNKFEQDDSQDIGDLNLQLYNNFVLLNNFDIESVSSFFLNKKIKDDSLELQGILLKKVISNTGVISVLVHFLGKAGEYIFDFCFSEEEKGFLKLKIINIHRFLNRYALPRRRGFGTMHLQIIEMLFKSLKNNPQIKEIVMSFDYLAGQDDTKAWLVKNGYLIQKNGLYEKYL